MKLFTQLWPIFYSVLDLTDSQNQRGGETAAPLVNCPIKGVDGFIFPIIPNPSLQYFPRGVYYYTIGFHGYRQAVWLRQTPPLFGDVISVYSGVISFNFLKASVDKMWH